MQTSDTAELHVNLKVNFKGNFKNFLLTGSEARSWELMEAMVKRSFGLCNLQVTYFDEDNEEISINCQGEYEEALKCASRQGNRLHMNVCETRGHSTRVLASKTSGAEPKRGFRPPQHFPTLAQVVSRKVQAAVPEQSMVIMKEVKGTKEENPPAWFTSYMEKFKDQVVREAVEKICREFSGQCCIHKPLGGGGGGGGGGGTGVGEGGGERGSRGETLRGPEAHQVPEVSSFTLPGASASSTPPCSSCRGQTSGGGFQCSVCTSCTLCEPCSFSHDPSHNLVRARTPLSIPERGSPAPDHSRFYRRGDRSFRKAEKQRLKAEKRLLKAEVKEIRKQLRMERRGIQWNSSQRDGSSSPVLLQPQATQHNSPERPKCPCPMVVPAMTAAFLDENLPDGTRLRPATKFIKYWKMRNTGTVSWNSDTKLKFMWGNLAVGSGDRWKEVPVPHLQPGQVGIISVALSAPAVEGSYTSHWRLAHAGEQFGPRVWCSIVVDPLAPAPMLADGLLISPCVTPQGRNPAVKEIKASVASVDQDLMSLDQEEFHIPSVDLLTAQDLLSFELLDINIVQELESVPNNTPVDVTPCMSPLPQDGHLLDKNSPSLDLIQEETECIGTITGSTCWPQEAKSKRLVLSHSDDAPAQPAPGAEVGVVPAQEESQENPSGIESVCETVNHSGTHERVSDHNLLRVTYQVTMKDAPQEKKGKENKERTRSRSSSTSSEDYIIILPDCFDTTRPLGESMYSSAVSQTVDVLLKSTSGSEILSLGSTTKERDVSRICKDLSSPPGKDMSGARVLKDMLCTSQTLDEKALTPEVLMKSKTALTQSLQSSKEADADDCSVGERIQSSERFPTKDVTSPEQSKTDDAEAAGSTEENNPAGTRFPGLCVVKGALSLDKIPPPRTL
ncbi:Next to BRCA1 gene 1 protein [Oryzias melastigma]|uniref:Next to BRCA1 gene 1 protein n=1 Tax=Oryzias melastigma TaxID=30732 RepID=A0A834CPF5_ORYME|nr:Next to BRCA1 gene 1 protein [Oryzias melastigma]